MQEEIQSRENQDRQESSRQRRALTHEDVRALSREKQREIASRAEEIAAAAETMTRKLEQPGAEEAGALRGVQERLAITRAEATDTLEQMAKPARPEEPAATAAESVEKPPVDESLERLNRHVEAAALVAKFESGAEMSASERDRLSGMLERGAWHNILKKDKAGAPNLKSGDTVVSMLVPNDAEVSVKNLNDNVFGPEAHNLLIAKRNEIAREEFGKAGLELLEQSFKDGYFKMPKGADTAALAAVIESVNARVSAHYRGEAARFREKFAGAETEFAKKKLKSIDGFIKVMDAKGYRMTAGAVEIGKPMSTSGDDYGHIELAVAMAAKGAMMAREQMDSALLDQPEAKLERYLEGVSALRNELAADGAIKDADGNVLNIFGEVTDGKNVYRSLNIDLIRDIRKGKFKAAADGENARIAAKIGEYMKKINILDIIKPYTHREISGAAKLADGAGLSERVGAKTALAETLRGSGELTGEQRRETARLLKQEGKDPAFESVEQFHAKALEVDHCEYISLDALDIGPKLLQDYERLLQQVENGQTSFAEAALVAGDATTEHMRIFRRKAMETYMRVTGAAEMPPALVGGDEFTLAIDRKSLSEAKLKQLLLELREMTEARVVHTVVSSAERASGDKDGDQKRRRDHLDALEVAERGAGIAKEIESKLRKLGSLERLLPEARAAALSAAREGLKLRNYAITERTVGGEKTFVVMRDGADDVSERDLAVQLKDVERLVGEQIAATVADLRGDGFDANEENVRMVLSMIKTVGADQARVIAAGSRKI